MTETSLWRLVSVSVADWGSRPNGPIRSDWRSGPWVQVTGARTRWRKEHDTIGIYSAGVDGCTVLCSVVAVCTAWEDKSAAAARPSSSRISSLLSRSGLERERGRGRRGGKERERYDEI